MSFLAPFPGSKARPKTESFFATLECELIERRSFRTRPESRMAIFEFIEGFYNPRRRHSALDYLSPVRFEEEHRNAA